MKNYSIVTTNNIESLIKAVNEMISNGYEPIGGMFLQQGMGNLAYYQTMFKRTKQDPEIIHTAPMPDPSTLMEIFKKEIDTETTIPKKERFDELLVTPNNTPILKVDKRRKVK